MNQIDGSCHCQSVKWSFTDPKVVVRCYCGLCRKLQGADYATWVAISKENFTITEGQENLTRYQCNERSHKNFCSKCGTQVFNVSGKQAPDCVVVSRSTIDTRIELPKPRLVYTEDKADWVVIHEDA